MRTVQESLRDADREALLDTIAYNEICNPILLLENKDMTVAEIQETCKKDMDDFIEYLLSLQTTPSDHKVLYMSQSTGFDRWENISLDLIDLNEIREDIYASGYAFEFTDWEVALGYLVADNKLTQDHMTELLAQFLVELSFFGSDPEERGKELKKVYTSLDKSMEELKEGKLLPAKEVFNKLAMKHGFPIDEEDDMQEKLRWAISEAEIGYSRYCHWKERRWILEGLGEEVPAYE